MGLTDKWEIEQTWGSHQAVLRAVLEVLKPQSAVECGCGDFSTPHLQDVFQVHVIEHDRRWARKMCEEYPPPPGHRWTVHSFRTARNHTRAIELLPEESWEIRAFYQEIADQEMPFDLLFNDTFTACRVPAAETLGRKAKWIILHDLEPPGPEVYQWPLLDCFLSGWMGYIHRPSGRIGKGHWQIPWTGLYSRSPLPLDELNGVVARESNRLWGKESFLETV